MRSGAGVVMANADHGRAARRLQDEAGSLFASRSLVERPPPWRRTAQPRRRFAASRRILRSKTAGPKATPEKGAPAAAFALARRRDDCTARPYPEPRRFSKADVSSAT